MREHWPLVAVLAAYVASILVVNPVRPVAIGDDWVYTRSVEILLAENRVDILPLTVTTLIFQVFWGAAFAAIFGLSFTILRISTMVLVFIGAWAFYGLCRQLGVSPRRSALGTAVYLFNPLLYSLGATYMSDAVFTSLLVMSLYFFVRGFGGGARVNRFVVAGSFVAALAFLVRQQGALIPLAVVTYLLVAGRLKPLRQGLASVGMVLVIPALVIGAYYWWLFEVHGVPLYQRLFVGHVKNAGGQGALLQVGRLSFITLMYLGLFVLPLAAGAVMALWRLARSATAAAWAVVGAVGVVLSLGLLFFAEGRARMPYIPDFLNASGLGPVQHNLGARPPLVGRDVLTVITGLCALCALTLALVVLARITSRSQGGVGVAGLVVAVLVLQAAGTLPSSFAFFDWQVDGFPTPSDDRYLLPLLPLTVALMLWALAGVRFGMRPAWIVTAAVAAFTVAGTRDMMERQEAVWDLADATTAAGVPAPKVDGGAAWVGYHLFVYSVTNPIAPPPADSPWWVFVYAPGVDGTYVVAGRPLAGYDVVRAVPLSSWLERDPAYLYLLRREGASGVL